VRAPLGDDCTEVIEQCLARRCGPVELEAGADHLDRAAMERGQVFLGQAEHARDNDDRERERQLTNEIGALRRAVDEVVDLLVHDVAYELTFPLFHRLPAERLLHEAAVEVVLRLVHLEDRVAEHLTHHLRVPLRRERVAVLQYLLHCVVAVRGVHAHLAIDRHELDVAIGRHDHRIADVLALHRVVRSHKRKQRVRVLDDAHSGAAVERLERVVVVVVQLGVCHAGHRSPEYCPPYVS